MKYVVYGKVVATKWLGEVEADNLKDAMKLADEFDTHISICHQCSNEIDGAEVDEIFVESTKDGD